MLKPPESYTSLPTSAKATDFAQAKSAFCVMDMAMLMAITSTSTALATASLRTLRPSSHFAEDLGAWHAEARLSRSWNRFESGQSSHIEFFHVRFAIFGHPDSTRNLWNLFCQNEGHAMFGCGFLSPHWHYSLFTTHGSIRISQGYHLLSSLHVWPFFAAKVLAFQQPASESTESFASLLKGPGGIQIQQGGLYQWTLEIRKFRVCR